jgi:hypothetical protein
MDFDRNQVPSHIRLDDNISCCPIIYFIRTRRYHSSSGLVTATSLPKRDTQSSDEPFRHRVASTNCCRYNKKLGATGIAQGSIVHSDGHPVPFHADTNAPHLEEMGYVARSIPHPISTEQSSRNRSLQCTARLCTPPASDGSLEPVLPMHESL